MKRLITLLSLGLVLNSHASTKISQGVKVIDPDHRYLHALANHPELIVDHVDHLGYEVYGPGGLRAWLNKNKIRFANTEQAPKAAFASYPSAEQTIATLITLGRQYPHLIQLIEIGKSVQGRPLVFARLTAPDSQGSAMAQRPEFKYVANMHGDEIAGREFMVRLIQDLAQGYGRDQRITQILNTTQVYIMPSMNPDGATNHVRYNANNTDLNRSFPDFTTPDNQNNWANREVEIQAMMKFQAQHHFKLSANFHGGAEVVNYPWDTAAEPFPLDNYVHQLSLEYAKQVPYLWNSREFAHGVTNGYAWYEVNGGMQDWSYYWHRDLQVTIELTKAKWPDYSAIEPTYQLNRSALLGYIEAVHTAP